jgi:hypothetical protein
MTQDEVLFGYRLRLFDLAGRIGGCRLPAGRSVCIGRPDLDPVWTHRSGSQGLDTPPRRLDRRWPSPRSQETVSPRE